LKKKQFKKSMFEKFRREEGEQMKGGVEEKEEKTYILAVFLSLKEVKKGRAK